MAPDQSPPRVERALLSVFDKTGLIELGRGLVELGIELVASGGTATALREAGLAVVDVAELTQSPEMLGGRVKTLHPRIHGGILARRELAEDRADLESQSIGPIDLVVVNLYPFEATVSKPDVTFAEAIEKIDIGGPSMIRSAAKNQAHVGVLVEPDDYAGVLEELRAQGGLTETTRRRLALKAFRRRASGRGCLPGVARRFAATRAGTPLRREPAPARGALRSLPRGRLATARQGALLQQPRRRAGCAGAHPRF